MNYTRNKLRPARLTAFALLAGLFLLAAPRRAAAQNHIDGWGLRTSIPAWFILSPSIGADISWNNRYMIAIDGSYNHGSAPKNNGHGVHLSSIGIEGRRYMDIHIPFLNKKETTESLQKKYEGLYLGADVRRLAFNYKFTSIGRDGWALTAGILVGYTFALPKNWNIDVSAGCGYIHSDYTRYDWYPQKKLYRDLGNRIRNNFGLTNANIALSYRFKCSMKDK